MIEDRGWSKNEKSNLDLLMPIYRSLLVPVVFRSKIEQLREMRKDDTTPNDEIPAAPNLAKKPITVSGRPSLDR